MIVSLAIMNYYDAAIFLYTGCNDTLAPLPQPKLKVSQYNQTYCWKVKSISAMDFQYILSNKNAQIKKIT